MVAWRYEISLLVLKIFHLFAYFLSLFSKDQGITSHYIGLRFNFS